MNPIREMLRDADPLRTEPMPSDEQRDSRRRAVASRTARGRHAARHRHGRCISLPPGDASRIGRAHSLTPR